MRCPGQDTQYWKPGDIFEAPCPVCGKPVEFFKDEGTRRCGSCGFKFKNPKLDLSCAEWCPQAGQCLADLPGVEGGRLDQALLARKLIEAMKKIFGSDHQRIMHALTVYEYAKELYACEGGDPKVVFSAAILQPHRGDVVRDINHVAGANALQVDAVGAVVLVHPHPYSYH